MDSVKEKSKETILTRYGATHPMKNEEFKNKIIGKLNNTIKTNKDDIIKKREETKLEKYNDKNYNNTNKAQSTIREKYGDFHLRLDEFKEKQKETMVTRYGVDNPLKLKKTRENLKKQIQLKYGVDHYSQSEEYKSKIIEKRYERVLNRMDSYGLTLLTETPKKGEHVKLKCNKCDNIFEHTQFFRTYEIKCPKCYPIQSDNNLNSFLEKILDEYGVIYEKNNRTAIKPFELDYYLKDFNVAIELNGNYYHSEYGGGKLKNYHINKTNLCEKLGIKLVHIFEDEILNKPEIVKSKISSIVGKTPNRIYARKTVVKDISKINVDYFFNENHIQGEIKSKIKIGLYEGDKLVFLVSFGKPRMDKSKLTYEIYRSSSILNTTVVGGFGKCLKFFIEKYQPEKIISYADIRWSGLNPDNTVYMKNRFNFVGITPPNYWYVSRKNYNNRLHRFNFRKSVLVKEGYDPSKTETEIMSEKGFDRIWDCGSMKFELVL